MTLPEAIQAKLHTQLDCLSVILAGADKETLARKSPPEKWSAVQNLAHLARYHEVFLDRLKRIRTEPRPLLPRYSAEEDPAWPEWSDLPLEEVQAQLGSLRGRLIAAIDQLPGSDLSRTAIHSRFGEMTVVEWLEFFLLHEAHHLYRVFQLARLRHTKV